MYTHFWRPPPRWRQTGLTLVELLVTIIIAGVAFAAIVPLFVQAACKNSADQARNQALNVAQDRIEKIRSLDYGDITVDNLKSSTFGGPNQFGLEAELDSAGGHRTMHVSYAVTSYPADSTPLTSKYKTVVVTVSWDPPPKPVKTVVLQTVVYRQYAGPNLVSLVTDPKMKEDGVLGDADLESVKFMATPDVGWQDGRTQTVHFQVWDSGWTLVTDGTVTLCAASTAMTGVDDQTFWWIWDSTFAIDGTYKISATASNETYLGPVSAYYFRIDRGSVPGLPTGLWAVAGTADISLGWQAVPGATGYEVFRAASAGGPWASLGTTDTQTYTDSGLPNSKTYWYTIRAYNDAGNGPKATPVFASTGAPGADTTPPTTPAVITATGDSPSAGGVHLTWTEATDIGSGMLDYQIYRATSSTGPFVLRATQSAGNPTVYNDNVGSTVAPQTFYYYVIARDVSLNQSAQSNHASATVAAVSTVYALTVQNTKNQVRYVWVQCMIGTLAPVYYLQSGTPTPTVPAPVAVAAKNGTQTWINLPPGTYNLWVNSKTAFPSSPQGSAFILTDNTTVSVF